MKHKLKQHIEISQLNELSKEGKKAYIKYFAEEDELIGSNKDGIFSPLATIGQLIEFLEEHLHVALGEWFTMPSRRGAMCDALWEACKEILES
jgi:hypothetical protein